MKALLDGILILTQIISGLVTIVFTIMNILSALEKFKELVGKLFKSKPGRKRPGHQKKKKK